MIFAANNMQLQTQNEDHHSSNVAMSSAIAAPKGKSVRKVAAAGTAPDVNIEMPDLQEAQRLGRKFKVIHCIKKLSILDFKKIWFSWPDIRANHGNRRWQLRRGRSGAAH